MADVIIYTRPDGGVSVVRPAPGVSIEAVLARSIPKDATNIQVVDESTLPANRENRGSWVQAGDRITDT